MAASRFSGAVRAGALAALVFALAGCGAGGAGDTTAPATDVTTGPASDPAKPDNDAHKPAPAPEPAVVGGGPATEQLRYDLTLTSFDGEPLALTVFQPKLDAGQPAPLVLYSHGWGGSRSTELAEGDIMTTAARRAWESGYYVITFDQRGFGESGGEANVQDPDIEGRDIKTILDWAEATLTPHLAYAGGDPLVGALGLSYGGGFQLVGAAIDPRFDALVPLITWHDLSYSLNPNRVPKSIWGAFLVAAGNATGSPAPWTARALAEGLAGEMSEETTGRFAANGLGAFCKGNREDGLGVPQVDAFLIQGINDTLFNTNEAVWNYRCLREAGNDVYLLVARGGHVLPVFQQLDRMIGDFDTHARCGDKQYAISDMAYRFLDGKLRSLADRIDIPRVCFVQDDGRGLVSEDVPTGGLRYGVASGNVLVGPPSTDLLLSLIDLLLTHPETLVEINRQLSTNVVDVLTGLVATAANPAGSADLVAKILGAVPPSVLEQLATAPRFIPLHTVAQEETLAGVPLAQLELAGTDTLDPRVFVGVGVRRYNEPEAELLHEQVLPLRGVGQHAVELIGISTLLQPGDQLGLMVYGFHPQYASSFSKVPTGITLSGSVEFPLH